MNALSQPWAPGFKKIIRSRRSSGSCFFIQNIVKVEKLNWSTRENHASGHRNVPAEPKNAVAMTRNWIASFPAIRRDVISACTTLFPSAIRQKGDGNDSSSSHAGAWSPPLRSAARDCLLGNVMGISLRHDACISLREDTLSPQKEWSIADLPIITLLRNFPTSVMERFPV